MPITRSVERNNRCRASPQSEPLPQADPLRDAPQSSAEATDSDTEWTDKTRTSSTETDSATDATPPSTTTLKEAEHSRPVQPSKPARSTSSKTSRKATRLAQARAELAQLQVKLASARIAVIEAEDSGEEEDSDIEEAISQQNENTRRLTDWVADTRKPSKALSTPAGDIQQLAAAITLAAKTAQPATRHHFELPIYHGSHSQWLAFSAAYEETSTAFSKQENMARLRHALRGRAREAVDNLLILCAEPDEIIASLKTRFGRPDAIALTELEHLRALTRPSDAPRELCIFANKIANSVATIAALRKEHYMYNPEVTKAIIEKLTPALRYRWYDFAAEQKEGEPDLTKLSRFLQREADRCSPYAQPEAITEGSSATTNRRPAKTYAVTEASTECNVCATQGHIPPACPQIAEADVNDRWDIAKKHSLCFRCLKHRTRKHACRVKRCDINDCGRFHHKLLHFEKSTKQEEKEVVASTWAPSNTCSYLKIVPVKITGRKKEIDTFALLDDGSTVTLIDETLARKAGISGPVEPLQVEGIGEHKTAASRSQRVTLSLKGTNGIQQEIRARTFANLKIASQQVNRGTIANYSYLEDISELLSYRNAQPQILIGQDNWHLLIATEVRRGQRHQPVASHTPLGWVLHGSTTRSLGKHTHRVHHLVPDINEQLRHHFAIESLTIEPKRPLSDPEARALSLLEEHTKLNVAGRYQTTLLWKQENIELPNNYDNAYNRLLSTERKIDKNPELRKKYETQMSSLIEKGYAELAPKEKSNNTWYLPHFPVTNVMKPGKIRIVHDAAAKTKGVSLNDHLLTGPDLLQSLPGVLMRFRQHSVAVTADIAEMFMQVKIREEDRDGQRYLWRDSARGNQPPQEYRMTSLIFGATSSPATAIYVKNINAERYQETNPEAYEAIVKCHYVDDYLQSFKTTEEAMRTACDVRDIHKEAHYELRQWATNSQSVAVAVGAAEQKPNILLEEKFERVLGLKWNPQADYLTFNLGLERLPETIVVGKEPSKRDILRVVMSLFDPLGFATPVTVRAKQILQETWRRGVNWDDHLEDNLAEQWREWMTHLRALENIKIPRCYRLYSNAVNVQLHTFVDASETAYAAALYWRTTSEDGSVHTSLVLAKARVAPLKLTSIPRLELQAAVMGCRMAAAVIEEHDQKVSEKTYWSDSRTVLAWIRNGARSYRPYVAHRIADIEENSKVEEWRWVPTKHNVADDATRDVPAEFDMEHRWFHGPDFLLNDPKEWPKATSDEPDIVTDEDKPKIVAVTTVKKSSSAMQQCIPDYTRFSKWERLLRTTARVLQFPQLCKQQQRRRETVLYKRNRKNTEKDPSWQQNSHTPNTTRQRIESTQPPRYVPIDAECLRRAEGLLIRLIQEESFDTELRDINNGSSISKNSRLRRLATHTLDGVLVISTRIDAATGIDEQLKRPPIIDGDHYIARLYAEYIHRQLHHAGVEATINECRQKYWMLRLRTTVRSVVHRCLQCRIRKERPPVPPTGNHPHTRLAHHTRAFTYTGVDYFGPLNVTVGRARQKRYVALFTCLTTRAIHLEIAASLSTNTAVMALRRMIARRGCPTEIWSDNGTNLQGAAKEIRQAMDSATQEEASKKMIAWRFIPPSAPFMGGAWERLVRSVKTSLDTVLHERFPTEEVLATLLAEIEFTVNSRPISHVSTEPEDAEALTPNHFLLGGPARTPAVGTFDDADLIGRAHWRASQRLADLFWARWVREYLPELQHRREPRGKGPLIDVGDVVFIADGTLPRNTWPRGLVTATFPGPDGIVRAVDVRTRAGTLRRPTKKLVVLTSHRASQ